jgi:hypothetical protein
MVRVFGQGFEHLSAIINECGDRLLHFLGPDSAGPASFQVQANLGSFLRR